MLFFDSVELSELVELSHKAINDLHALVQLSTALLVASVLFTLDVVRLVAQVVDLVLE